MPNGTEKMELRMEIEEKTTRLQWDRIEELGKQINEALYQNGILIERLGGFKTYMERQEEFMKQCVVDLKLADQRLGDRITLNEHFRIKWVAAVGVGILVITLGTNLLTQIWLKS